MRAADCRNMRRSDSGRGRGASLPPFDPSGTIRRPTLSGPGNPDKQGERSARPPSHRAAEPPLHAHRRSWMRWRSWISSTPRTARSRWPSGSSGRRSRGRSSSSRRPSAPEAVSIYVGAGTSGRLGVLDAAEMPPTYGTDPEMVQGIIAGGYAALVRAQEGAEDRPEDGATALDERHVDERDFVLGIATSGSTPFVHGALARARERGREDRLPAVHLPSPELVATHDVVIAPLVGPEVITGSTRMKAGTATKLVLNTLTTGAMVRLGKVYGNLMVDLQVTCQKLQDRGERILMEMLEVERDRGARAARRRGRAREDGARDGPARGRRRGGASPTGGSGRRHRSPGRRGRVPDDGREALGAPGRRHRGLGRRPGHDVQPGAAHRGRQCRLRDARLLPPDSITPTPSCSIRPHRRTRSIRPSFRPSSRSRWRSGRGPGRR